MAPLDYAKCHNPPRSTNMCGPRSKEVSSAPTVDFTLACTLLSGAARMVECLRVHRQVEAEKIVATADSCFPWPRVARNLVNRKSRSALSVARLNSFRCVTCSPRFHVSEGRRVGGSLRTCLPAPTSIENASRTITAPKEERCLDDHPRSLLLSPLERRTLCPEVLLLSVRICFRNSVRQNRLHRKNDTIATDSECHGTSLPRSLKPA